MTQKKNQTGTTARPRSRTKPATDQNATTELRNSGQAWEKGKGVKTSPHKWEKEPQADSGTPAGM